MAGKISKIYPLRNRLLGLLPQLKKKYTCYQHPHPGYNHSDAHTNKYLIQMAKAINQSKIVLSDSGKPRNRFGKYVEIVKIGFKRLFLLTLQLLLILLPTTHWLKQCVHQY